jgi:hypothetical protein
VTRWLIRAAPAAALLVVTLAACGSGESAGAQGADSARAAAGDTVPAKPDSAAIVDSLTRLHARLVARDTAGAGAMEADTTRNRRPMLAGTDPLFARREGWPVAGPPPLPGSILPFRRIIAYYGNPASRRMGVLGEYDKDEMLRRLDAEVAKWNAADPAMPVMPALHLVAVVAQGAPGRSGDYRSIMGDSMINRVHGWAKERNGIFIVDIQTGLSDIRELLPHFDQWLAQPDVHLAVDPEFMMGYSGSPPGRRIGTMRASDVNYVIGHLTELVRKHNLPPKVLIIHRFTRNMVPDAEAIRPTPQVQVVMHMDGWGAAWLKRDSYKFFVVQHPVQFTGVKLFYHNDTKKGDPLMTPQDLLNLRPVPVYIQYQ